MPADSHRAVFLSYASQDADAARRICEALRAAGVEVWFDQSELRGGDSWDQKIRRQIKDCTLFLPLVSANTQARREGYFRLEWKLADDRTHLMAKGTPFVVPVCIDETKDWDALVPDSFMSVQWTRLPAGEQAEKFAQRVVQLLAGEVPPAAPRPRPSLEESARAAPPAGPRGKRGRWLPLAAGACVIVGASVFFGLRRAPTASVVSATPAGSAAAAASWPRAPELRRAVALLNGFEAGLEDFALAEEIANQALAKNSTDPEAVTVMARVQVSYLFRGFDRSDARRAAARRYAERAVQLAPGEPEALAALGVFNVQRGGNLDLARELLDQAIRLRPDEVYFHRHRDNALFVDPRVPAAEAIAAAERTAARFPRDPLAQYELARHYRDLGRMEDCERAIDRTLALAPIVNAIGWKARIALNLRGDFAETKALLDSVPARLRSHERVVISRWMYAMAGTDCDEGLQALQSLTSSWIEDFYYVGPKALLTATLLEVAGKRESARLHYEAALTEIRGRQVQTPADVPLRNLEAWALIGLGRIDEASAASRVGLESVRRPYVYDPFDNWWFSPIPRALLLGDRATAIALIREAASPARGQSPGAESVRETPTNPRGRTIESRGRGLAAVRLAMKQDARMARFRDDPEIAALLAEPKTEVTMPALTEGAQLAARATALIAKSNYTREDLAIAEQIARRATESEPDNAAAWGVRAAVHATYVQRNWDVSEKRMQEAQSSAQRALRLNADEVQALWALGYVLTRQGAHAEAEQNFRRALKFAPTNNRLVRALGAALIRSGRPDEQRALLLSAIERDPRDPLLRYDLAQTYAGYLALADSAAVDEALRHLDAGLAVQPFGGALLSKAVLLGGARGDFAGMRATLNQMEKLPLSERTEDRAVFVAIWAACLEHDAHRMLAAAALSATSYFEDTLVPRRPKDWSVAMAQRLAGRESLAQLAWQRAEAMLRQRLREEPANQMLVVELATTLAWLGRRAEALREIALAEGAAREEPTRARTRAMAEFYAAMGDAAKAVPYLRQALNQTVFLTEKTLGRDPWFDLLRGQPEFEALLEQR